MAPYLCFGKLLRSRLDFGLGFCLLCEKGVELASIECRSFLSPFCFERLQYFEIKNFESRIGIENIVLSRSDNSRHIKHFLILLVGCRHPPLCQLNRLAQHADITDMVGQDQHQRRIEIGTLRLAQAAMGLDDRAKRVIRLGEIRFRRQCPARDFQMWPVARASAASSAARVGCRKRAAT